MQPQAVTQFVDKIVDYSSEYNGWPASNMIGTPNTYPNYGDLKTAWAPSSTGKQEFVVVQFKNAVFPCGIEIYETYNCGAVVKVLSWNYAAKDWAILWQGAPECGKLPAQARIFKPPVTPLQFPTNRIKLELDGRQASGYPEIDAIRLIGYPAPDFVQPPEEAKQWASKVIGYSSEYSNSSWSANQVLGAANTYPKYGDNSTAWAPKSVGQQEYLELEFPDEVYPTGIEIYETYWCGSVVAIKLFNPGMGSWTTVWQGPPQVGTLPEKARIFSPPLAQIGLKARRIRIEMDGRGAAGYCEIDAVRLIGWTGNAMSMAPPQQQQPPMYPPMPQQPMPQQMPPQPFTPPYAPQPYPQQPYAPQPYPNYPPQPYPQQFAPPVQQVPPVVQPPAPKEGTMQAWPVGRFYIRSRLNGLVLDAKGEGTKPGTEVILWPQKADTKIKNQVWIFEQGGIIRNEHNKLCIDIKGETGPDLICWTHHGKPNQMWIWDGVHIQSKMNGKFMDVKGASMKSGTPAIIWQPNNGKNQEWDLIPFKG